MGIGDADDYNDMLELLCTYNVMEKRYPAPAEIEKGRKEEGDFWYDLDEGDFYYYLGTEKEMIARIEGIHN